MEVVIVDLCDDEDQSMDTSESSRPEVNLELVKFIKRPRNILKIFPNHKRNTVGILEFLTGKKVGEYVNENLRLSGYNLYVENIVKLVTPKTWLPDVVIQNYIFLLVNNCKDTLNICTDTLASFQKDGQKTVVNWLGNNNLLRCQRVVVLINPNKDHWALFVVHTSNGVVYSFDSFNRSHQKEFDLVCDFLNKAFDCISHVTGQTRIINWKINLIECPRQTNQYDCGVFACTNARCYLLGKYFDYSQSDIRLLRQRIAFELINTTIVEDRTSYL
ncbi:hypothetical protein QTP88_018903 [Uroleucon formosanum]